MVCRRERLIFTATNGLKLEQQGCANGSTRIECDHYLCMCVPGTGSGAGRARGASSAGCRCERGALGSSTPASERDYSWPVLASLVITMRGAVCPCVESSRPRHRTRPRRSRLHPPAHLRDCRWPHLGVCVWAKFRLKQDTVCSSHLQLEL